MRVSIIIPTLNGAAPLPALLSAVGRVRDAHLEIVAIDSGSRDDAVALLGEAGARILALGGVRFGHASARNRAAAQASGETLLFMTQDGEPVGDGWLAALVEPL